MEKVSFWKYQKIIVKGAWVKFSQKYGIRDFIVSAVVGVIVGIMTTSLVNTLATLGVFLLIYFINLCRRWWINRKVGAIRSLDLAVRQPCNFAACPGVSFC